MACHVAATRSYLILLVSMMVVAVLPVQSCALPHGESASNHREPRSVASDGEQFPASLNAPFEVITVERQNTSQGNRFTIRVRKNVEGQMLFRFHAWNAPDRVLSAPDNVVQGTDGVWAASFTVGYRNSPSFVTGPWFSIYTSDLDHWVVLQLNHGDSPGIQNVSSLPSIYVSPQREAVYEPGEIVNITGAIYGVVPGERPGVPQVGNAYGIYNREAIFSGVDLDTGSYGLLTYDDIFIYGELRIVDNRVQTWVALRTSTRRISGYFILLTKVSNTGGFLVNEIIVNRVVLVRPSNQSGAYPPGYLAFTDYANISRNGSEFHYCQVDTECSFRCSAAGETVSDIEVFKVLSDGSLENVSSAVQEPAYLGGYRCMFWKFHPRENSGDSDHITTFKCRAYGINSSQMVTRRLEVQTFTSVSIDAEKSSMTVENGTTAGTQVVTLNCSVSGRPLPGVRFSGGSSLNFYAEPDTMTPTREGSSAMATKVVVITNEDLEMLIHDIRSQSAETPYCLIYSQLDIWNSELHYFDVSEFPLMS